MHVCPDNNQYLWLDTGMLAVQLDSVKIKFKEAGHGSKFNGRA